MNRPACVAHFSEVPAEPRPRFTSTPGVGALVRRLGDHCGLTRMGLALRAVAPGFAGTNRHFHNVEEEWVYVLSGRGTVRIGPLRLPVQAGHFIGFPPGPAPHHLLAEGDEPLVFLEGGERRPAEDVCWYPDIRQLFRKRTLDGAYVEPPAETGSAAQVCHVDAAAPYLFQHDLAATVQRLQRDLHTGTGLRRQAVYCCEVAAGHPSTVYHYHTDTDEWVYILEGSALARVGNIQFTVGPGDFLAHPAGGAPHVLHAATQLRYLMGGEIRDDDVIHYPEAGYVRRGAYLEKSTD